jgi:hypothetical protein
MNGKTVLTAVFRNTYHYVTKFDKCTICVTDDYPGKK